MARAVTVIPATINPLTRMPNTSTAKRRVAGYARVSTDSEEQQSSYEAQVDYYTQYIQSRPDWEFVRVFTDEGISATNTKKRDGFNEMVRIALAGGIDLIVTKSVSRFARNTVDSLTTVRKLKEKGVEVYFEKENIYTLDSKGELLITIMSSLAQEESRSISENVTWGKRKQFADGKVALPYKQFLGYRKGADGLPEIVPKEAKIVRRIYSLFIGGKTTGGIARLLTAGGIPTPGGKTTWQASTIESILTNEKYRGDARLQKKITVDFLTKKMKVNEGEVPQYYVEHSHPAIIDPKEWDLVQIEMARRKAIGRKYSGTSVLSSRLICGDCGEYFGSKVWHNNQPYRKTIWRCNGKYAGTDRCQTPNLDEEHIKDRFVVAFNEMCACKDMVLADLQVVLETLADFTEIDVQIEAATQELAVVIELTHRCVAENSQSSIDQTAYAARYAELERRYADAKEKVDTLQRTRQERQQEAEVLAVFIQELANRDGVLAAFDDKLWLVSVDKAVVHRNGKIVFHFYGGVEICQ